MRSYYHRPKETSSYSSGGLVSVRCELCGIEFQRTVRKVAWKKGKSYCSRACKDRARNKAVRQAREAAKPLRSCVHCGAAMPRAMRRDAKFCSAECNEAAHAQWRKMAKRRGADGKAKFNRADIADRDQWRCGICGGLISRRKKHPDPYALSVDHIVPLARGGSNEPTNLQAAHLRCNLSRRDRD